MRVIKIKITYSQKLRFKQFLFLRLYHFIKWTFPPLETSSNPTMSSKRLNAIRNHIKKEDITYLEIGIENANTFRSVGAKYKVGVDPYPLCRPPLRMFGSLIKRMPSDQFFRSNEFVFDLAFIDGLHTYEQTYKDLLNTFLTSSSEVLILIDDVVPSDIFAASRSQLECQILKQNQGIENNYWMGDVFKLLPLLYNFHTGIKWATIIEKNENPQLLVWRSRANSDSEIRDMSLEFAEVAHLYEYKGVFKDGIPDYFQCKTLEEALEAVSSDFS